MKILILISILAFGLYLAFSISKKSAVPESYSGLYYLWKDAGKFPLHQFVTFLVAALLMPVMIEVNDGSPWQFLGFFAPCYLAVVGAFPDYKAGGKVAKVHYIGVSLCGLGSLGWMIATGVWWILPIWFVAGCMAAGWTDTYKQSWMFWLEMCGFASVYTALFFVI